MKKFVVDRSEFYYVLYAFSQAACSMGVFKDDISVTEIIYRLDRLCGLVVRVSGYRYRGLGFDFRSYQIF